MARLVGPALLETIAAERAKFTAPLLLIHGLWCSAAVWRKFMGYCAHRGWECFALNLRGHAAGGLPVAAGTVCWADHVEDVRAAIAACPAPPIVIGHDLGGALALHGAAGTVRAKIALAPVWPAVAYTWNRAASTFAARLARRWSRPLPAPRGDVGTAYFGAAAPGGTFPDSGTLARELIQGSFSLAPDRQRPTLLIAGGGDAFCRAEDVRRLAAAYGATYLEIAAASHALPWEPGWEQRVSDVHRWLVQTLGEDLLVPEEDEAN